MLRSKIIAVLMCVCAGIAMAEQATSNVAELKKVTHHIDTLQKNIKYQQHNKVNLTKELQKLDISISQISSQLHTTQQQLQSNQQKLEHLQQQRKIYLDNMQQQREKITAQFRTAYKFSREPYLKMLLNLQNTHHINRMLSYYHYFNQARQQRLYDLQSLLTKVSENRQQISAQSALWQRLLEEQTLQNQQLQQRKKERSHVAQQLERRLATQQEKLQQLLLQQQHLRQLVDQLAQTSEIRYTPPPAIAAFASQQGHLQWPIHGKILNRFGEVTGHSAITANAVLIDSKEGNPVYAVYAGRIVFANWLHGFGLLLIIDHGDGYMSLYGRNESLYRKVGDWVNARDLIARVGKSGGFLHSGLYFSIRQNGKPVDPGVWCKT